MSFFSPKPSRGNIWVSVKVHALLHKFKKEWGCTMTEVVETMANYFKEKNIKVDKKVKVEEP